MANEEINLEDGEMQELANLVAEALQSGDSPEEVIEELVGNGVERETAQNLVAVVELQMFEIQQQYAAKSGSGGDDGGGMGWLIWIGFIVGFNILSYVFNWGWVIY